MDSVSKKFSSWKKEYQEKLVSPSEAVRYVHDGDIVYVGCSSSVAYGLCDALGSRAPELKNVGVVSSNVSRPTSLLSGSHPDSFYEITPFMGPGERVLQKIDRCDYTSMHLSEVDVFYRDIVRVDVAFLEVSPPDENGYFSLGAHGGAMGIYVLETADRVILQVNRNVPYIGGGTNLIHIREVTAAAEIDTAIFEYTSTESGEETQKISEYILDQIPDGACLQLGLGGVTNAIGYGLKNKNELGIHSELYTDSMMELTQMGVITNRQKSYFPGKSVAAFAFGTKTLYRYLDHNDDMVFQPFPVVNNIINIAKNDNMISVNAAMAVDLLGQVCADNLAGKQYSATGGQLDFVRGAQMSKNGKSFIAFTSSFMSKSGKKKSRILSQLPPGSAVTTPRSDVQYVVTEHGCVNLKKLTAHGRVHALIELADPEFRPQLLEDAKRLSLI